MSEVPVPEALIFLIDLAGERLGGRVLAANDEFFAPKENLIKDSEPISDPDKYTDHGKWMDGWETRRRREPGHDWALIRLGLPGIIRHVVADTSHFTGNYPEACSIEACELEGEPSLVELVRDPSRWSEIMERTPLLGDTKNHFPVEGSGRATHVRFVIYPDGGVARLRLFGEVVPGPDRFPEGQEVDLAAIENGGRVIDCSDHHFSVPNNMLMPGDAEGMHDGWETRRRRGPGHDWAIVKLGVAGEIKRIVVDTSHFKGNAPGSCDLETVNAPAATVQRLQGAEWTTLLPATKLEPDRRQALEDLNEVGRVTHVRFNIHPDGGVARLRLFGTAARS